MLLRIETEHNKETLPRKTFKGIIAIMAGKPLMALKSSLWAYPSAKLIEHVDDRADAGNPKSISKVIEATNREQGIEVNVFEANIGTRYTQYLAKVIRGELPSDIGALKQLVTESLGAYRIRCVVSDLTPDVISFEVPNVKSAIVSLGRLLNSKEPILEEKKLSFILGKNISGKIQHCDLISAKHLLMTGQTGSGKSVFYNNLLLNLLLTNSPSDLRLIVIDPKRVEFAPYNDIPHLISPVILDPNDAKLAIQWATDEIDRRYTLMGENYEKSFQNYNDRHKGEVMPTIAILCDEISDLMMNDNKFFEEAFVKIAQKGQDVGVHLILATSRPSTDVITDKMVQAIHYKIAFTTASEIDSRRIIGRKGAEDLLGMGDILVQDSKNATLQRLQVPFVSDEDVQRVTVDLKRNGSPEYVEIQSSLNSNATDINEIKQELYLKVLKYVVKEQQASTAMFQKKFKFDYRTSARLMEKLEENGVVGPAEGAKPRKVYRSEY